MIQFDRDRFSAFAALSIALSWCAFIEMETCTCPLLVLLVFFMVMNLFIEKLFLYVKS